MTGKYFVEMCIPSLFYQTASIPNKYDVERSDHVIW